MQTPFLSGQLLLSMPGIGDDRFERTVIAMCSHDEEGAMGLVVNRVSDDLTVRALMEQLDIDPGATPDRPVLAGGPVEPGRGFVLHDTGWEGQGTVQAAGAWSVTATTDVLKAIAAGKGPARWHAVLGYAGWGAGQLEGELVRHGWQVAPGSEAIVFETPAPDRWAAAFGGIGINVGRLSATPGRA